MDCSVGTGNLGCLGGSLKNTMRYVQQNGLMKFEEYPYTSQVKFERRLFHSTNLLSSDKYWVEGLRVRKKQVDEF